jgi:hypothetical protein
MEYTLYLRQVLLEPMGLNISHVKPPSSLLEVEVILLSEMYSWMLKEEEG